MKNLTRFICLNVLLMALEPGNVFKPIDGENPHASMKDSSSPRRQDVRYDLKIPSRPLIRAPELFYAMFNTSKGFFKIEVHRNWSPRGVDRFYELVKNGFFDDTRFYRVTKNYTVQFGLNGSPEVNRVWRKSTIQDDPVLKSNFRGFVSYAMAGPGTRATEIFVNYRDNPDLDAAGFAPFGQVTEGMEVLDKLESYGEMKPLGAGADFSLIQARGNSYLDECCTHLDRIISATIGTEQ